MLCAESTAGRQGVLQRTKRTWILPPPKIKENTDYTKRSYIAKVHKAPALFISTVLTLFICSVKLWHCQACYHLWLKIFTVDSASPKLHCLSANSCHDEQTLHTALVLANTLHLFYYYYF